MSPQKLPWKVDPIVIPVVSAVVSTISKLVQGQPPDAAVRDLVGVGADALQAELSSQGVDVPDEVLDQLVALVERAIEAIAEAAEAREVQVDEAILNIRDEYETIH